MTKEVTADNVETMRFADMSVPFVRLQPTRWSAPDRETHVAVLSPGSQIGRPFDFQSSCPFDTMEGIPHPVPRFGHEVRRRSRLVSAIYNANRRESGFFLEKYVRLRSRLA